MNYTKRITTAIATGAILVNALAPVAFAQDLTVTGNGASSNSSISSSTNSSTVVNQTNNANIVNNVTSNASSGGNSSNFNTGGNTTIHTGNATTNTTVSTAANLNKASVANCGACSNGAANVTISGNGAYSDNGAKVANNNSVFLDQANAANVVNAVRSDATTGKNDSSFNTGGDTVIHTGDANTKTNVSTKANANVATIGGASDPMGGSSVVIKDNGALSDNGVALSQNSAVVLAQANAANIVNDVHAKAKTGYNDAGYNTGGFNAIVTGNATTNVTVDNAVNFNAADVNCDCILDAVDAKVAGNGAESDNGISAASNNALFNDQANAAALGNNVDGNAKSGHNDLSFSTGSVNGDPLVWTGDTSSTTKVNNSGNVNMFDNGITHVLPGNWNGMGVTFDMSSLWATLSMGWTI
jgi:hypothetical protein